MAHVRAAYDLKKLRGKQILQRIGQTARYQPLAHGLRAIAAPVLLRDKAIKPLDAHYAALRTAMQAVFHELGVAA
jgi:hypothetical protein